MGGLFMEFFIIPTGVVLIALALIELVKAVLYLRNSEKKEGEIISIRKVTESSGGTALKTEYPNVTYIDDDSQWKTFTSTFGFMPGKHRTGDQVFIRYYRNDIRIDHWFPLWGGCY
jgi:hypothetical protein